MRIASEVAGVTDVGGCGVTGDPIRSFDRGNSGKKTKAGNK